MDSTVIVWDIEIVPDLKGFAAANDHNGKSDDEIRTAMGDKFPKHICYELFRGRLSDTAFQASEANLVEFIKARGNTKPHLVDLT